MNYFSERLYSPEFWAETLPNILGASLVAVIFIITYLVLSKLLLRALNKTSLAPALQIILIKSIFKWTIFVIATIMVLSQLGIDVTAAIAGVGIAGIAIGFAAKESLANVLAGFSIFIDKLYVVGDWVEVFGKYGQVKEITLRTTKIRTLDNIFVIVPNSEVTQNPVINFSEEGMVRVTAKVGIAYKESVEAARDALISKVKQIEGVKADPAPTVVVDELGDSSVNLLVFMWVDEAGTDPYYRFLLTETCKAALDEAGIEIPFPQRVVHQT